MSCSPIAGDGTEVGETLTVTVVLGEGVQDDTAELLAASGAVNWPVAQVDKLALAIRGELGL